MINKHLKGTNPPYDVMNAWTPQEWLEFTKYAIYQVDNKFDKAKKRTVDAFVLTDEKVAYLLQCENDESHPWHIFCLMCDYDRKSTLECLVRIRVFLAIVLKFLRDNPRHITEEMKALMDTKPHTFRYAVSKYFSKALTLGEGSTPVVVDKQMKTLEDVIDVMQSMIAELKKRKMSDLSVKELLSALPKLVDSVMKMTNKQKIVPHLTQINIGGSTREMEESALQFVKSRENE